MLGAVKERAKWKAISWYFLMLAYVEAFSERLWGDDRASRVMRASYAELGIFAVLVFGVIALVVVSITLLFGMQIAGEFAQGIDVTNDYSDEANQTVNSTGTAFELFGTSTLVNFTVKAVKSRNSGSGCPRRARRRNGRRSGDGRSWRTRRPSRNGPARAALAG